MKRINQFLVSWFCLLALLLSVGCGMSKSSPADVQKIVYSNKLLKIAGQTQDGWIEDLRSVGNGEYERIYRSEDTSVTMELQDAHKAYWQELRKSLLDSLRQDFAELGEGYLMEYKDNYTQLDLYYTLDLDAYDAVYYILNAEVYCVCLQLLSGCEPDGWSVEVNIYNADTGNLVKSGTSDTGLSYTEEDWNASA